MANAPWVAERSRPCGQRLGIARAGRARTDGKLELSRGEPRRKLPIFVAASRGIAAKAPPGGGDARAGGPSCTAGPRDPAEGFADRHSDGRPRAPLDGSKRAAPARACARKMPPPDAAARGAGPGGRYRASGPPAGGTGAPPGGGGGAVRKA